MALPHVLSSARLAIWAGALGTASMCAACSRAEPGALTPVVVVGSTEKLPPPSPEASIAIDALRAGEMPGLTAKAEAALARDSTDPRLHVAMALGKYHDGARALVLDMTAALEAADERGALDHARARRALTTAESDLARIDEHLALAAADGRFALDLCLACWPVDWNGNGQVDDRDLRLFQIEIDGSGEPVPDADPRRKPTFRFDHGDLHWARAMVAFQRAALDVVLAYEWAEVDRLLKRIPDTLTLRLKDGDRIEEARTRILEGLAHSDRSRLAYLAEIDDDREWVPSPTQRDHPLPLPMDAGLYETWRLSLGDLRAIVEGRHGLDVAELASLGDHQSKNPPRGYIDVGRLLTEPGDIVIPLRELEATDLSRTERVEAALGSLFGEGYARQMTPSPLLGRMRRMKKEVEDGSESLERKLRYLLWIN